MAGVWFREWSREGGQALRGSRGISLVIELVLLHGVYWFWKAVLFAMIPKLIPVFLFPRRGSDPASFIYWRDMEQIQHPSQMRSEFGWKCHAERVDVVLETKSQFDHLAYIGFFCFYPLIYLPGINDAFLIWRCDFA